MHKNILAILAATLLLFAASASALTIDINGGYDSQSATYASETETGSGTKHCVPDDGNFTIKISDTNACTAMIVTVDGEAIATTSYSSWTGDDNAHHDGTGDWDDNVMSPCTPGLVDGQTGVMVINMIAPTAEGLHEVCVADDNFAAFAHTASDCEWVSVKPDSTYTNYTITNTDANVGLCSTTAAVFAAFTGKIEDSTGYGRIETDRGETWDFSGDIDFDAGIVWSNANKFGVTESTLTNQVAKVTFLKPSVATERFEVRRNDSGCGICTNIASNDGQVSFTTSSFSTYEVKEQPVGTGGNGGTPGTIFQQPTMSIPGIDDLISGGANINLIVVLLAIVGLVIVAAKMKK